MKFDDVINKYKGLSYETYGLFPIYTNEDIYKLIEELKKEYAPTIEMTKNDKDILLYNLENYPFDVFIENVSVSDKEKFGLPSNNEFRGLSIEDLMQAWLHPESIKVIDKEK